MAEIYPSPESRRALEVFCLYRGRGQYFDLTTSPITRASFTLGGDKELPPAFRINTACTQCGQCTEVCPQNCIETGTPYRILQEHCLHCGNCYEICPAEAVSRGAV
ncbi:MAG: 4Fe-4S binding protein [Spirochaetales bacterium]|nr:4Fe-4S binding protein [Spirochaetales bacterium]